MALPLSTAKAAVQSLSGADLFSLLQRNITIHDDSHWSESKALAAVAGGKPTCGYYYRKTSSEGFQHNTTGEFVERLSKKAKKSQWKKVTIENRLPINATDCATLCSSALTSTAGALFKKSDDYPNAKFLYYRPLPEGYGGETIKRGGTRVVCEYICIVITLGPAAKINTHFPAAQGYADDQDDLA